MRYPSNHGLALPIHELGFEVATPQRRLTNNHHLYFEKQRYQDKRFRQIFRGLLPHVYPMYIGQHTDLHERYSAPVMPSDFLMIDVVEEYLVMNGVIDVVKEHHTAETYEINSEQWQAIKRQYRGAHGSQIYEQGTLRTA